ncbi:MAG: hypothetical protein IPK83_24750 [Planctomycetes bacterium]|nr:hypothetical protein [Planctomycetota bacterium]
MNGYAKALAQQLEGVIDGIDPEKMPNPDHRQRFEIAGALDSANIDDQPAKRLSKSVTVALAWSSSPQMNMSGGPPGNSGLNMCGLPRY